MDHSGMVLTIKFLYSRDQFKAAGAYPIKSSNSYMHVQHRVSSFMVRACNLFIYLYFFSIFLNIHVYIKVKTYKQQSLRRATVTLYLYMDTLPLKAVCSLDE